MLALISRMYALDKTPVRIHLEISKVVMSLGRWALAGLLFLSWGNIFAQSVDRESVAVLELGAATGASLKGGGSSFGPNLAVEVTPIENWLELEAGVSHVFGAQSAEWDTDVLFKKPWVLSDKVELMVGAGPAWIHTHEHNVITNSISGEVAVDFMVWPSSKHRFGWYLEPDYEYNFGRGHEQSVGISGGLLISIR